MIELISLSKRICQIDRMLSEYFNSCKLILERPRILKLFSLQDQMSQQSPHGTEDIENSWESFWSPVYVGIPKKFLLILVKECHSNIIDELASKNEDKQAKSKVFFFCVFPSWLQQKKKKKKPPRFRVRPLASTALIKLLYSWICTTAWIFN